MNRILASRIKAALPQAAVTQVAACGTNVINAQITFSGSTAYAVWERRLPSGFPFDANRDNGRAQVGFKINYPLLSDEAMLTRGEAELITGYTLHETGHVLFTCNNIDRINKICEGYGFTRQAVHPLANGLEDARMEASVIKHGARNARAILRRILNMLTNAVGPGFNPCDLADAAFALAIMGREALGNGNAYTDGLLERIPEPKRSLYAWAMDELKAAPDGYDATCWAYRTAAEFLKRWRALEPAKNPDVPPPPVNPNPQGDDTPPPIDDGEEEESHDGDEFEDEGSTVDDPTDPVDEGDNDWHPHGDEGNDEESDDESDDEDGGGEESDDEDDEEWDDDGADGHGGKDTGDEDEDDDDGDDDGGSQTGDDVENPTPHRFDFNDEGDSSDVANDAEPNIDKMFKRINKRTDANKKSALAGIQPCQFEDPIDRIRSGQW